MSEETKSTLASRPRHKAFFVANPDEDDSRTSHRRFSPSARSPFKPLPSAYAPAPLTTNLPPVADSTHNSQSSRSNPTLSSPSSTSSPAVESTPPPSTPGLAIPPVDFHGDTPARQEPYITALPADRSDTSLISSSRTGANLFGKMKHWPRSTNHVKSSSNISPTATLDSYTSPTSHGSRSTLSDRVNIMVTTDSDSYARVDITGAVSPDFIRERIFTKLQIADEDQCNFSIYQTQMGGYAQGEALSPEALFDLCYKRGDHDGTLKLFVSHSSATVHDLSPSTPSLSPTVNTIPPVLPYHYSGGYAPLRPRHRSGSHQGSISSASERLHPEVAAGYEASVSDDDHDRDTNRSTLRPPPQQQLTPVAPPPAIPPSPNSTRRLIPRPASPVSYLPARPSSPSASTLSPDHARKYPPHPASLSPNRPIFAAQDDTSLTPSVRVPQHIRAGSDAAAERERELQASENRFQHAGQQWAHYKELEEQGKLCRRATPPPRRRREQAQQVDTDEGTLDRQARGDSWVLVQHEQQSQPQLHPQPQREHFPTPQEGPRSSPGLSRRPREPANSPVHYNSPSSNYSGNGSNSKRPVIPTHPRNPPPAAPARPGQAVHPSWAVTWKMPEKNEQRQPAALQTSLTRLTVKSMDNLRHAYQHPTTLQPGGRLATRKLPLTRPSTTNLREGTGIGPGMYSMSSDNSATRLAGGTNIPEPRKPYDLQRSGPIHPLPRPPAPSTGDVSHQQPHLNSNGNGQRGVTAQIHNPEGPGSLVYPNLASPGHDPLPRPQSAFGDIPPSPSPFAPRQAPIFGRSESEDTGDTLHSPRALSPNHPGVNGRSVKDEGRGPVATTVGPYAERTGGTLELSRTPPRSPISPLSPRFRERHGGLSEPSTSGAPESPYPSGSVRGPEDSGTPESTLRPEEHGWLARVIDSDTSSTLIPRPAERTNSGKSITPLPPIPVQQPSMAAFPHITSKLDLSPEPVNQRLHREDSDHEVEDEEEEDSDDENGTLWTVPMAAHPSSPRPKSILKTRPHQLSIHIGSSSTNGSHLPIPKFPPLPEIPPPPPLRRPMRSSSRSRKAGHRESTFTEKTDSSWATRPPAEDLYERLEDVFPEHDLDKPVIDSSSGGTSPTAAEHTAIPPPVCTSDKTRIKGKKSIRIVAEEHKKKIDRTSRSDSSTITSMMRKRSTKLWGSRVEEVTTEQAKGALAASLPDSPSGGPKPIFKWVRGEMIGRGTYGRVYLALNATTGEMIAVKQVEMPTTASDKSDSRQISVVEALKLESETLKDLDHPNIVQYLGYEETPRFLSIFLEYVPGGSVGSCLRKHGKFDQDVTKSFTSQILGGLEYLHSKGILHRDLKADNILVEASGTCKISDFGISKRTDDIERNGQFTAMQGSVFWMAPEVLDSKEKKGYNAKIDIWSVGCVVLEMWAGERPWRQLETVAVMMKLYHDKQPPPVPEDIILPPVAYDFRNKCFATNPEQRPTAAELRKHPYLTLPPGWVFNGFK